MTTFPRHVGVAALLVVCAFAAAACGQAVVSPSPSPAASASASASASVAPTASPSLSPSPSPTPTPTRTASPTPLADCAVEPQEGALSSDRMTDVVISSTPAADVIRFVFGRSSLPGPAGQPRGDLAMAEKPYTFAGSGEDIDMEGDRVLQLRFLQMSLSSDTGEPTYDGEREFRPDFAVLRHAVEFDATEGQIGWYIGYDGPGCVTLGRDGNDVTLSFAKS
jgi:hypothetical protein